MIYLDYNATTPLCAPARAAMRPYLEEHFGNPSSIHAAGREARAAVDDARDQLAAILHAKPHELIFTGSGTEANNLAVLGLARSRRERGRHLICSSTEHHAVLHAFEHLQKHEGFEATFLRVDGGGRIDLEQLASAIRADTTLVSVMSANNETGVVQPIAEIGAICRARGVLLHSDMVQSFAKQPTDLAPVDAASFAAHKFYGPKGAGLLYLRAGIALEPIQFGGAHENQRRPGTENVAAIAGLAAAAAWASEHVAQEQARTAALRDQLWAEIAAAFPDARQNGDTAHRLANTLNVSFLGLSSETMLMVLDLEGVCVSSGSACMVGSVVASHVLLAMGTSNDVATSAIRFSLGKQTTAAEMEAAAGKIRRSISRLGATKRPPAEQLYAAV
ncbi:MAG: cysteine desulfurase [Verrucomicrobiota bacterium]|nr:cysteine desulfurase [Verrucomicrobiota bacterium]